MPKALKFIITSRQKLVIKYRGQFRLLQKLFAALVKADRKRRGTATSVIYIDDEVSARRFGFSRAPVINEKHCKIVVDEIYKKHKPAYIVLFGAQDVIPFQCLHNELFDPEWDGDNDRDIESDLPYACESSYGKDIGRFTNPSRVVGRLPDLQGQADLTYVQTLIHNICDHKKPRPRADYMRYFALTAEKWINSTGETVRNLFEDSGSMVTGPANGKQYSKAELSGLTHLINCHGAPFRPDFFGQENNFFPVVFNASRDIPGKIPAGTVVASECCYGARILRSGEEGIGIASRYLAENALAFMGSTCISYGLPVGQGLSDIMCEYFLANVHAGASTGRALLQARQDFLTSCAPHLDAHELKTLAQFTLLGDPSLSLVEETNTPDSSNTVTNRRNNLYSIGINLPRMLSPSVRLPRAPKEKFGREVTAIFEKVAFNKSGMRTLKKQVYGSSASVLTGNAIRFRTYRKSRKVAGAFPKIEVIVVKEDSREVLGWRHYISH